MSNISPEAPSIPKVLPNLEEQQKQPSPRVRLIARIGAGLLLAGLSVGPGLLLGWKDARNDQSDLAEARETVTASEASVDMARQIKEDHLFFMPAPCLPTIADYLADDKLTLTFAEIRAELRESKTCPPELATAVIDVQRDQANLDIAEERLEQVSAYIPGAENDAAHNYELLQGAGLNLAVSLAAGAAVMVKKLREPYIDTQSMLANGQLPPIQ